MKKPQEQILQDNSVKIGNLTKEPKQELFLMSPTVDFCFKELMESERVRRGFIAAVLHVLPEDIKTTTIMPSNLRKGHKDEKLGILDIRIIMQNKTQIDIEMQVGPFECWPERTLFYLSKMYTSQIESGDPYSTLAKCIHIGILNHIIYPEWQGFHSCFHIREDMRGSLYTDKLEFHVIELPKMKNMGEPQDELQQWVRFLNGKRKEDFMEMASKNEYIEDAYNILKNISADEMKRLEYEAREKAIRDYNHQMYTSKQSGIREGIERGIERGIEQGLERGIELMSQLTQKMVADNRTEELMKAITDKNLRMRLLEEYNIQ